jgi:hypothetical protein
MPDGCSLHSKLKLAASTMCTMNIFPIWWNRFIFRLGREIYAKKENKKWTQAAEVISKIKLRVIGLDTQNKV